jgi:outer membrane protein, multidrug efflux system
MNKFIIPVSAVTLALVGCSLSPKYTRPDEKLPTSLNASAKAEMPVGALDKWWESFNDPALNKLVDKALVRNTNLLMAYGNVKKARAALGLATSEEFMPNLTGNSVDYRKNNADWQLEQGQPDISNLYYHYGLLSYELDLFGRLESSRRAAVQDLLSSEYGAQSTRMLVAVDTANAYFNLVATREQLNLTEASVETRRAYLKIQERRFDAGYGSDAERQQAVADLASAEVTLPDLKKAVTAYESALRYLVGDDAAEIWNAAPIDGVKDVLPEPPVVDFSVSPASLLERRPDILAAEAQLKAANQRIGVARAQRLPTISLSGLLGTTSSKWEDLFSGSSETWTVQANLTGPIYDFGRSRNRVKSAKAAAEIAEVNYRAVVRSAFKELRDAATGSDLSRESVESRIRQVDAWNRNYDIARNQSATGYSDPLAVLDAQRGQLAAQLSLVSAKRDRLVSTVSLCHALGGGWNRVADPKSK